MLCVYATITGGGNFFEKGNERKRPQGNGGSRFWGKMRISGPVRSFTKEHWDGGRKGKKKGLKMRDGRPQKTARIDESVNQGKSFILRKLGNAVELIKRTD